MGLEVFESLKKKKKISWYFKYFKYFLRGPLVDKSRGVWRMWSLKRGWTVFMYHQNLERMSPYVAIKGVLSAGGRGGA